MGYMCQILVYWMWKRGVDPDNAAIPYLTAIGDLLGTSLLAMAFLALEEIGDTSLDNLEHVHHNVTHHNDSMEGVGLSVSPIIHSDHITFDLENGRPKSTFPNLPNRR